MVSDDEALALLHKHMARANSGEASEVAAGSDLMRELLAIDRTPVPPTFVVKGWSLYRYDRDLDELIYVGEIPQTVVTIKPNAPPLDPATAALVERLDASEEPTTGLRAGQAIRGDDSYGEGA